MKCDLIKFVLCDNFDWLSYDFFYPSDKFLIHIIYFFTRGFTRCKFAKTIHLSSDNLINACDNDTISAVVVLLIMILMFLRNDRATSTLTAVVNSMKQTPFKVFNSLEQKQYSENTKDDSTPSGIGLLSLQQNTILLFSGFMTNQNLIICPFSISRTNSACFLVTQCIMPSSAYLSHGHLGNFLTIQLANT